MEDKSKIGLLDVDRKFRAVINNLNRISDELDDLCIKQVATGFDQDKIKEKLAQMDNVIAMSPVIEEARISGSADVQKIIDQLNKEVAQRLQIIRDNFRKEDRDGLEGIEESFKNNQTNTMQRNLSEFDAETVDFQTKSVQEREADIAVKIKKLNDRIKVAEFLQKVVDDGTSAQDIIDSLTTSSTRVANVETTLEEKKGLKTESQYKKDWNKYWKQLKNPQELSEEKITEFLTKFEPLSGNKKIKFLLDEIKKCITYDPNEPGKITNIDKDKLNTVLRNNDPREINWKTVVGERKNELTQNVINELKAILKEEKIFKFYPNETQSLTQQLEGKNPNLEEIQAKIKALTEKDKTFFENIEADRQNISGLKLDLENARKVQDRLTKFRQKTYTGKVHGVLGVNLQLTNEDGTVQDLAKIDLAKPDILDSLYEQVTEQADPSTLDREFETNAGKEYKPNWLQKAWWTITHPGEFLSGERYANVKKKEWIKIQITREVGYLQRASREHPDWYLSPSDLEKVRQGDMQRAAAVKKQAREDLIKKGKTKDEVKKEMREELDRRQEEDDYQL